MQYKYITKDFRYKGKRYKVRGKTLEEAIEKKLELIRKIDAEDIKASDTTVEEWAETALETYKTNVGADYRYQMELRIQKHILTYIGHKRIQDITPLDCQRILNNQSAASSSQIRKVQQEMYFIFDTARKNDLIRKNPCEDLTAPIGIAGKRRSLTAAEREHFLKVCEDKPYYTVFMLMLFCGLRSSEARQLRYEDITDISGVKFFHVRGTKTAAADRLVPIPPEIQARISPNQAGIIARGINGQPLTKNSYRRLSDHLRRDMNISMGAKVFRNQLVEPLPLAPDFVPYMLRHTYCTDLKKKGVDLRLAKQLMGHSDIKMTADIYDHADDESALIAARQMGYAPTT